MEREVDTGQVRVVVEMVDAVGVEKARAAQETVHLIAFAEQEFGEIGPVLPGHPSDQCALRHAGPSLVLAL